MTPENLISVLYIIIRKICDVKATFVQLFCLLVGDCSSLGSSCAHWVQCLLLVGCWIWKCGIPHKFLYRRIDVGFMTRYISPIIREYFWYQIWVPNNKQLSQICWMYVYLTSFPVFLKLLVLPWILRMLTQLVEVMWLLTRCWSLLRFVLYSAHFHGNVCYVSSYALFNLSTLGCWPPR